MKLMQYGFAVVMVSLVGIALVGCDSSSSAGGSDMDELATRLTKPEPKPEPPPAAPAPEPEPTPPPVAVTPPAQPENETTITITVKNPQGLVPAANQVLADNQNAQAAQQQGAAPLQAVDTKGVVGKKQRRNRVEGPLQYYGAISNVRVLAEDRAIGWQIQKSMDLFVNTHDGKFPKTTEEYMKEIIEPNMIVLPELPPGHEYFYDPDDHQLKIGELVDEPPAATPPAAQ